MSRINALVQRGLWSSFLLTAAAGLHGQTMVYTDVYPSDPYFGSTATMWFRGITSGCASGPAFCPASSLTRGQVAVFIVRGIYSAVTGNGEQFTYTTSPYFRDVQSSNLLFPYIQKMKDLGITGGCQDGTVYCPDNPVTYGQLAIFAGRGRYIKDHLGVGPAPAFPDTCSNGIPCWQKSYFQDVTSSNPSQDAFYQWTQKAYEIVGPAVMPWTTGQCPYGNFCSGNNATRGQTSFNIDYGILGQAGLYSANASDMVIPAATPPSTCFFNAVTLDQMTVYSLQYTYAYASSSAQGINGPNFSNVQASGEVYQGSSPYQPLFLNSNGLNAATASWVYTWDLSNPYRQVGNHNFISPGCNAVNLTGTYTTVFAPPGSSPTITIADPIFASQAFFSSFFNQNGNGVVIQQSPGYTPISFATAPVWKQTAGSLTLSFAPLSSGSSGAYQVVVMNNTSSAVAMLTLYVTPSAPVPITSTGTKEYVRLGGRTIAVENGKQ